MAKQRIQFEVTTGGYHALDQIETEITPEIEQLLEEGFASIIKPEVTAAPPTVAAPPAAPKPA